jgi:hypothetical protein
LASPWKGGQGAARGRDGVGNRFARKIMKASPIFLAADPPSSQGARQICRSAVASPAGARRPTLDSMKMSFNRDIDHIEEPAIGKEGGAARMAPCRNYRLCAKTDHLRRALDSIQ